jgi:hypothetical protein
VSPAAAVLPHAPATLLVCCACVCGMVGDRLPPIPKQTGVRGRGGRELAGRAREGESTICFLGERCGILVVAHAKQLLVQVPRAAHCPAWAAAWLHGISVAP